MSWSPYLCDTSNPNIQVCWLKDHVLIHIARDGDAVVGLNIAQLSADVSQAQPYVTEFVAWLKTQPRASGPLLVRLTARSYTGDLVQLDGLTVTELDLDCFSRSKTFTADLAPLKPVLADVEALEVSGCANVTLTNSKALRACKQLRRLRLRATTVLDMHNIPLTHLESLDLAMSSGLTGLTHLCTAPHLCELNLSGARVKTLEPLRGCHMLEHIAVSSCQLIRDLSPLADLTSLVSINASFSTVRTLGNLSRCTSLRVLDLANCRWLSDISPLAGAPSLEVIRAYYAGIQHLGELNRCQALRLVDLTACSRVADLTGFGGAPSLEVIKASESGVRTLGPLHHCKALRVLDLHDCHFLTDLSPLLGAPTRAGEDGALAYPDASRSLVSIDVRGCQNLRGVGMLTIHVPLDELLLNEGSLIDAEANMNTRVLRWFSAISEPYRLLPLLCRTVSIESPFAWLSHNTNHCSVLAEPHTGLCFLVMGAGREDFFLCGAEWTGQMYAGDDEAGTDRPLFRGHAGDVFYLANNTTRVYISRRQALPIAPPHLGFDERLDRQERELRRVPNPSVDADLRWLSAQPQVRALSVPEPDEPGVCVQWTGQFYVSSGPGNGRRLFQDQHGGLFYTTTEETRVYVSTAALATSGKAAPPSEGQVPFRGVAVPIFSGTSDSLFVLTRHGERRYLA